MTARLRRQDGSTVIAAMVVMGLMMTLGLATYATVDVQSRESGRERHRESAFNLGEGGLQQQGYVLGTNWRSASSPEHQDCTFSAAAATTPMGACPQPPNLANATGTGSFSQVDFREGVAWTTAIRDNDSAAPDAYTSAVHASGTNWDENRDNKLWVRATGTVRGRTRTLVALLKRERLNEPFPRNAITAGSLEITNSGAKTFIDAVGSQVVVRCQTFGSECVDQPKSEQIEPPNSVVRQPAAPPGMSAAQVRRFRTAAQTASPPGYHTSCPSGAALTGAIVFVDLPSGSQGCTYNNVSANAAGSPGIVVMPRGTLSFKGTFYGVLYLGNEQASAGTVLELAAGSEVIGGVAVDGPGRLEVGAASGNRVTIKYAAGAFDGLSTYGTAGLVQNTWRELPAQP